MIRHVASRVKAEGFCGYTDEFRERGERRGFPLVGFDGATRLIAHVDFAKCPRVGKYGVDVQPRDAAALLRPDRNARFYLVDEIGKMECLSPRFVAAMRILLTGGTRPPPLSARVGTTSLPKSSEDVTARCGKSLAPTATACPIAF